jgi:hypothetical protein
MLALLIIQQPFAVIYGWLNEVWHVSAFSIQASYWTVLTAIISANARRKQNED